MIPGLLEQLPALEASLNADGSSRNVMFVADALRLAGRPQRAAELLQEQVHREPARISPRVLLAWCLEDIGDIDSARAMLDTVRSIDPGNPFAREPEPTRAAPPTEPTPTFGDPSPEAPRVEPAPVDLAPVEATRQEPQPPSPAAVVRDPELEAEPERALTEAELNEIPPGPLYSATLAEIFERQGFEEKAIEIYEEILRQHPERTDLRERIVDLRAKMAEEAH